MRGLWLCPEGLEYSDDIPEPRPDETEATVRVSLSGVCGTDLELLAGMYGFTGVPGHEFMGTVEDGPAELLGARVVGEINCACGQCRECLAGRAKHCANRRVLGIRGKNGAFAERVVLPIRNLHVVPEDVSDEQAVFTEPLAAALDIPRRVLLGSRDRVLVVGAGRLGQLIARVLHGQCARLDVVARDRGKLERLPTEVGRLDGGVEHAAYDVVVDASGTVGGFAVALDAVRPEGMLVVKSTAAEAPALDLGRVVVDEIRIVGSRCGPFEEAIALLAGGAMDLGALIDGRFGLRDAPSAVRRAGERGVIKVLIDHAI